MHQKNRRHDEIMALVGASAASELLTEWEKGTQLFLDSSSPPIEKSCVPLFLSLFLSLDGHSAIYSTT